MPVKPLVKHINQRMKPYIESESNNTGGNEVALAESVNDTDDYGKENTYEFEGYIIEIEHTPGRSMFQAMEASVRRLNDSLTYNVI
jgi:hypothetical protein